MGVWLFGALMAGTAQCHEEPEHLQDACEAANGVGWFLTFIVVGVIWLGGLAVVGLLWLVSKPEKQKIPPPPVAPPSRPPEAF